jgi:hypothetical protein
MNGMDMGAATELGSFASFLGYWVPMMTAMMLPAAPPVLRRARVQSMPLALGVCNERHPDVPDRRSRTGQKLLPEHRALDLPVALAIVALGISVSADL